MRTRPANMNHLKAFVDDSIFCGTYEYVDSNGQAWRVESDRPCLKFYKFVDDDFSGSFHYVGAIKSTSKDIKKNHMKFLDAHDGGDE